jgi:transposase
MNKLINLTEEQRERLLSEHKKYRKVTGNTNLAYRINAILLLDDGLTPTAVARCLLLDDGTVKSYADKFQSGEDKELLALCYHGRSCNLNGEQQQELKIHISSKIYLSVAPIIAYVSEQYHITYTQSGMRDLLHYLGFSYKKPCLIGAKASFAAQKEFIDEFDKFVAQLDLEKAAIAFMDGVHPQHNTTEQYGWIKTGNESCFIHSNTGRQRLNILGAVDAINKKLCYSEYETISYPAVIDLFKQIEQAYPTHEEIHIFADNAKYNCARAVQEYLAKPGCKIRMHYLPTYSPNLNIIERLWRLMRKYAIGCKFFEKFISFKGAVFDFLKNCWQNYPQEMANNICHNFHLFPEHAYAA